LQVPNGMRQIKNTRGVAPFPSFFSETPKKKMNKANREWFKSVQLSEPVAKLEKARFRKIEVRETKWKMPLSQMCRALEIKEPITKRPCAVPSLPTPDTPVLPMWEFLCRCYDNRCLSCGEKKPLTKDHVIPKSWGGTRQIHNLQPLCTECNLNKGQKWIDYRDGRCPLEIPDLSETAK
jgi:hypothetical protein